MNYISYYYRQVEWFAAARLTPLGAGGGFHEELQPGAGGGRRGASVGPRGGHAPGRNATFMDVERMKPGETPGKMMEN